MNYIFDWEVCLEIQPEKNDLVQIENIAPFSPFFSILSVKDRIEAAVATERRSGSFRSFTARNKSKEFSLYAELSFYKNQICTFLNMCFHCKIILKLSIMSMQISVMVTKMDLESIYCVLGD